MIKIISDHNTEYGYSDLENEIRDKSAKLINSKLDWNNPQIGQIAIETINRCNGECGFCPANRFVDIRKTQTMSDDLFKKIVNDINQMQYKGQICLSLNNEPLLDKNFIDRCEYIRRNLPNNKLILYTNGTLLDGIKLRKLSSIVDEINIDSYYTEHEGIRDEIKTELIDHYEEYKKKKCNISIFMQNPNLVKLNRGGQAPNKRHSIKVWRHMCARPFWEFSITPCGDVIACCHDVYSRIVLGNVMNNTIKEIWESENYRNFRMKMMTSREKLDMCNKCDQVSVRTPNNNGMIYFAIKEVLQDKADEGYILKIYEKDKNYKLLKEFINHEIKFNYSDKERRELVIISDARYYNDIIIEKGDEIFTCEEGLSDIVSKIMKPQNKKIIIKLKKLLKKIMGCGGLIQKKDPVVAALKK